MYCRYETKDRKCGHPDVTPEPGYDDWCPESKCSREVKPKTRGDVIREMSNYDLARIYGETSRVCYCCQHGQGKGCTADKEAARDFGMTKCELAYYEWLQEDA